MKIIHKVVFSLFVFTIAVVTLHWLYGDKNTYRINPNEFTYLATNDQLQKGASTSTISKHDNEVILDCELKVSADYKWPYCGVSILYDENDPTQGVDFSDVHTVRLDVDFKRLDGGESPAMRVYLRNYNPVYSQPDNEYTHKYNGLDYRQADYSRVIEVPLKSLQVLTWWLVDNKIPIAHAAPEFNNINRIEFATGSGTPVGVYQLHIRNIEFVGHYIDGEKLMLLLLFLWVGLGVLFSVSEIRHKQRIVRESEVRQKHLKNLNQSLREENTQFAAMAHRDALTGAMNRHAIRSWLEVEYSIENETRPALSVIYLDIDHFKKVNDVYGHKIGDDILREFTLVVMAELEKSDRFARWGGEEFVIFCPTKTVDEAYLLAERLRQKIEQHAWMHDGKITASLGVTELYDETAIDMLTRADELLYTAKRNGRNRVEVAN
ncbi:GGDEF domain-containing protein [Vibrio renipiscarius]|uniref:diguanylate cyclase n=1 Tax=Vibrio renipiscarius TaxID=1461322 RepID=A0A0C2NJ28_9VIBR|nr:GGDEF domain-containing protein [Vibrio renipiscarius]KII79521.1 diguanylate cyclase [Vibrio renipiscarius]KII80851.1 diguanylate cyclase [Vibrio renipiscarius]